MFDRKPGRAFFDKMMAGLDEIDMLDQVPNAWKDKKNPEQLMDFVDEVMLDACVHDKHAYQAMQKAKYAILKGDVVDYGWLPVRARAFMQAFEVA